MHNLLVIHLLRKLLSVQLRGKIKRIPVFPMTVMWNVLPILFPGYIGSWLLTMVLMLCV